MYRPPKICQTVTIFEGRRPRTIQCNKNWASFGLTLPLNGLQLRQGQGGFPFVLGLGELTTFMVIDTRPSWIKKPTVQCLQFPLEVMNPVIELLSLSGYVCFAVVCRPWRAIQLNHHRLCRSLASSSLSLPAPFGSCPWARNTYPGVVIASSRESSTTCTHVILSQLSRLLRSDRAGS